MKKIIILLTLSLMSTAINAQSSFKESSSNPYFSKFEFRVSHGIAYLSDYYGSYNDAQKSEAIVRYSFGPFFAGGGVGYVHENEYLDKEFNVTVQFGYKIGIKNLWIDIYSNIEKGIASSMPSPFLGGLGVTLSYRIFNHFYILADGRTQYAMSGRYYGYGYRYLPAANFLSIGLAIKI